MKKITLFAVLAISVMGSTYAQQKDTVAVKVIVEGEAQDSVESKKVVVEMETKDEIKKNKTIVIPGKVVTVRNKEQTWSVGIEPSLDFGWSRFNTSNTSTNYQTVISDLALEKGPHFGLNIFKAHFNLTKNGVLRFNSGLGIDYNSYHMKKAITFEPAQPTLTYTINNDLNISKNILRSTYATMPFMLSAGNSKFNVMAGYELSALLSGKTKQIIDGNKIKERDNFNLNPFRQGLVFRLNYSGIGFYAKYYLTDVFAKNQGPAGLQNFNLGISLGGF